MCVCSRVVLCVFPNQRATMVVMYDFRRILPSSSDGIDEEDSIISGDVFSQRMSTFWESTLNLQGNRFEIIVLWRYGQLDLTDCKMMMLVVELFSTRDSGMLELEASPEVVMLSEWKFEVDIRVNVVGGAGGLISIWTWRFGLQ
ncbi:unnamed protein product [Lactuca virosa]|uniref:Uncharacterized protein n=1 Tax=Lactuca virosa TaxID=75947 RepID=A0AAU9NG32_9ASTR|nr:unnamed protein product [Lactuca virosa]